MTIAPSTEPQISSEVAAISVRAVEQDFVDRTGKTVHALDPVSFDVPKGQFIAVVGPSGCGKTTVLNMLAGLLQPTSGDVLVNGKSVRKPLRNVGYMSARDGLLPWRSAIRNVSLGLELRGIRKSQRYSHARELLKLVGLEGFEDAYRTQLSQGMRQRAAIARTLAIDPEVLLMDEPFAALDAQTKVVLQQHFAQLWETDRKTVLLVTHDLDEAVALADRVIVFSARPGRIIADVMIDLPRPRDVGEIRYDPRFRELTHSLWASLRAGMEQS